MISQNLIPSKSKFCFSYWQSCVLHRPTVSWLQTSASELTSPLLSTIWDTGFHSSIFSHNQLTTRSEFSSSPHRSVQDVHRSGYSITKTIINLRLMVSWYEGVLWTPLCPNKLFVNSSLVFYYWMSTLITLGFRLGIVSRSSSARLRAEARSNVRQPQGLWPQDERKQPSHLPGNTLIYSGSRTRALDEPEYI